MSHKVWKANGDGTLTDFGYLKSWPEWQGNRLVGPPISKQGPPKNGIFLDVSYRHRIMVIAIVVVKNGRISETRCLKSEKTSTAKAEEEAIKIALNEYSEGPIFCDCKDAVDWVVDRFKSNRVFYVNRKHNRYAHGVARK